MVSSGYRDLHRYIDCHNYALTRTRRWRCPRPSRSNETSRSPVIVILNGHRHSVWLRSGERPPRPLNAGPSLVFDRQTEAIWYLVVWIEWCHWIAIYLLDICALVGGPRASRTAKPINSTTMGVDPYHKDR